MRLPQQGWMEAQSRATAPQMPEVRNAEGDELLLVNVQKMHRFSSYSLRRDTLDRIGQ